MATYGREYKCFFVYRVTPTKDANRHPSYFYIIWRLQGGKICQPQTLEIGPR